MFLHRVFNLTDPSHTLTSFCRRTDSCYHDDTRFIFLYGVGNGMEGVQPCRLGTQIVKLNTMDVYIGGTRVLSGVDWYMLAHDKRGRYIAP